MKLIQFYHFHINLNMATYDFMMVKDLHLFLNMKTRKGSHYYSKDL